MIEILISTSIFTICFFIHSLLHHILIKRKIITLKVMNIYLIGLLINIAVLFNIFHLIPISNFQLPFTAILWYSLLSILTGILYFPTVIAGAQAPSDIILTELKYQSLTKKQIYALFSADLLIYKRFESMLNYGFILYDKNRHIKLSRKGKFASKIIYFTHMIMGLSVGG
jgi:hypothetical protein